MRSDPNAKLPDGITEKHLAPDLQRRFGSILPFAILGGLLATSLTGLLGGLPDQSRTNVTRAGQITIIAPATLRNGEIFEISAHLSAPADVARPVLAISASLFRHITFNTMTPEPTEQTYADGMVEFEFKPLAAGKELHFRMSGQSNPSLHGGNRGFAHFRDGERELAIRPVNIRILP